MAKYLNYTTLVQNIRDYLERGGSMATDQTVTEQIPWFINNAERKIAQILKLQGQIEVLVDPVGLPAGVAVITKPDRWRQTVAMQYGSGSGNNSYTPLFPRSYEFIRAYWPDDSIVDAAQPPLFYSDYDLTHWLVGPTPAVTFPLESTVYCQPPLLDEVTQTNFWTDYTPNLLLYSSLLESAPFLKADDRIATWTNLRDFELSTLVPQDLQKILDRAAERSRP